MRLLRGLLLKPTLNLLSWLLRRNGNSIIIGGPLGWTWQATLDTTHHGALAGPANAHRHSDLANIGIDNHHARDHAGRHQDGGADEISVAGLSGELADNQPPKAHESTHVAGGSDDIDSALAIAAMANLTNTKIWQGNGSNRPAEIDLPAGGYTEGARVYRTTTQGIADATLTAIGFNAERYDTDIIHSLVANTERLTCRTAGKYIIIGMFSWEAHAAGYRNILIELNGVTWIAETKVGLPSDNLQRVIASSIWDMSVGDYVELYAYQTSGGTLNVLAYAADSPEFMMQRIG